MFVTPQEMQLAIASRLKTRRLYLDLSQQTLAERSGVSLGVLKKFEQTGNIALKSLLKLALTLGALDEFNHLFAPDDPLKALSLDVLINEKQRKRGRK